MPNKPSTLIAFAPGWGDPSLVIDRLVSRFHKHLPDYDTYTMSYQNRGVTEPIDITIQRQTKILSKLAKGYDRVFLIGHSLGGLIIRGISQEIPVSGVVTIASPHRGTKIANLAPQWFTSVHQMRYISDFLKNLPEPKAPAVLSIQASFDPLLWPQTTAKLPSAENITIPRTSHISVCTRGRTFWEIYAWLEYTICPDKIDPVDYGHCSDYGCTCSSNGEFSR